MNYVIARGSSHFRQNGSVLDKVEKLHLKRSSLSPESSTGLNSRSLAAFQSADRDLIQR